MLQKIGPHFLRIGFWPVDLVDRHDHRHFGSLGVVDRFDRLRHHRIICSHNQNDDVRNLRPTGPHGGKGRVTRRVEEGQNLPVFRLHLVRTNVLSDPTRFARHNLGISDRIQQRGLTVVDVAHNGNNRRTRFEIFFLVIDRVDYVFNIGIRNAHNVVAEFFDNQFGCICVNRLVLSHHHAHLHEGFHHLTHTFSHSIGQLGHHNCLGQLYVAHNLFPLNRSAHGFLPRALLFPLHRSHGPLTTAIATCQRLVQRQLARPATFIAAFAARRFILVAVIAARSLRRRRFVGTTTRCFPCRFGRRVCGHFSGTLGFFSLLALAFFFFGLGTGAFFTLFFFPFFGFRFCATAITFFLTRLFFCLAAGSFFRFAGLGGLDRFQPALHFCIRNPSRTARRIARRR